MSASRLYCNIIPFRQAHLFRCNTSMLHETYTRSQSQLCRYSFSTKQTKKPETDQDINTKKTTKKVKKRFNFQLASFMTLTVLGIGWITLKQLPQTHQQNKAQNLSQNVNIGQGEWTMTDHDNNKVNNTTFLGKYQIVYFGFTYCPDVCPRELSKIANALRLLEKRGFEIGKDIQPIFVSVDPNRDSPEIIKNYVLEYHPKIKGLVGTPKETEKIAKAYKAYYSARSEINKNNDDDDYYVDHSSISYIMSPNGEWLGHSSIIDDDVGMADKICEMVKESGGQLPSVGFRQKLAALFA